MQKITFEEWMKEVDKTIDRLCGMSSEDIPDWLYRDAYDDGVSAKVAAAKAIRAARIF